MKEKTSIFLAIIILASVCLLAIAANKMSFWEDETYTSSQSQKTISVLLEEAPSDVHPILPILFSALWGKVFGYDEPGLRSLSIVVSALSLFTLYFLAKNLFDKKTALYAVAMLAFSPLFIMFGHQARYYPLAMLLSILLALELYLFLFSDKVVYLTLYTILGCLLIYISYSAFSVIVAANIWWIIDWMRKSRKGITGILKWLSAQGIIFLAGLPLISHLFGLVDQYYATPNLSSLPTEFIKRGLYLAYTYAVGQTISPLNPLAWIGCLLIVLLIVLAVVKRKTQLSFWFSATFLGVIVLINLIISFMSGWLSQIWQNLPHWSFYALPFWVILLASGISQLKLRWSTLFLVLLAVVYGSANINYYMGKQFIQPIYAVPWNDLFKNIKNRASDHVAVVCSGSDVTCRYYAKRYGLDQKLYTSEKNIPYDQVDQVWWIQIFIGQERPGSENYQNALSQIKSNYSYQVEYPYARQDDDLRWIKHTYLGQDDYEYRVIVYCFYNK